MFKKFLNLFKKREILEPEEDSKNLKNKRISADPLSPLDAFIFDDDSFGFDPSRFFKKSINDFPHEESLPESGALTNGVMDAAISRRKSIATDAANGFNGVSFGNVGDTGIEQASSALLSWYGSQTFIGWQACALVSQHWLVDKACTMAGEDAARNGWEIKVSSGEDLDPETLRKLRDLDVEYKIMQNLTELHRYKNIFGIRVAIFEVDSDDDKYYEKPFNIDGVTRGSYKGISQVDPYWMTPILTSESTADPASKNFYEPEYWVISGRKYHRSHLIVSRAPQPPDILKPTYVFGGIPLTQRIYERVYAAERTANEAPLLSMSKRTTAIHMDNEGMVANQGKIAARLKIWQHFRDNYSVKILGTDEQMEQFDISLADFDSVIMNQYQLVAAIAEVPSTKLLGTSPKGFNATGEFEMKSYHEHLVSIQSHTFTPMLDRHYMLLSKSSGIDAELRIIWKSTDTPTEQELADLNDKKATTAATYINIGAISPEEVRQNLKSDDHSGFNRLDDDSQANEEPGMSPDALAKLETGEGRKEEGQAQLQTAANSPDAGVDEEPDEGSHGEEAPIVNRVNEPVFPVKKEPGINAPEENQLNDLSSKVDGLNALVETLIDKLLVEGEIPGEVEGVRHTATTLAKAKRTTQAMPHTVVPHIDASGDAYPQQEPYKLPKLKLNGFVCAIENPRGTVRKGSNLDGSQWQAKMAHHYGFIRGVMGADGDELDCFIGPNLKSDKVFVVNQNDTTSGEFDEHKCMLGFDSEEEARQGYLSSFGKDWNGLDSIVEMTIDQFRNWTASGNCNSPLDKNCIEQINSSNMTA